MDYNKGNSLYDMKINLKLNSTFHGILEDMPAVSIGNNTNAEIALVKNEVLTYESFYNTLYTCVLQYVPSENENVLQKAISMLPRVIRNVKRLKTNKNIICLQNEILNKYFYESGDYNIKEKLVELKEQLEQLVIDKDYECIDSVLQRFDIFMREKFLSDINDLSKMIDDREK
jgi:hypothetical protein